MLRLSCGTMTAVMFALLLSAGVGGEEKAHAPTTPTRDTLDLDNLPTTIFDDSTGDWVVDRWAGNATAGSWFYQGPALEVGGLQRPGGCVEGENGTMYLTSGIMGGSFFKLMEVTPDGTLRLFMGDKGMLEGPIEACRAGGPIWNPKEKTLYLTGPNCLRKIVEKPDGSKCVEVVAGIPNKAGKQDGAAKEATFPDQSRGVVCNSKGTFFWLQDFVLRRIENGTVSSIPLKRTDGSKYIFHMIYGGKGLCLGENDNTLYINDFYNVDVGFGILRCNAKTGELTRICGTNRKTTKYGKRWNSEADGPALTHAGARCGMSGRYHPFYNALWVWGPDESRVRWLRLGGDGWVRTAFGARRPGTKPQRIDRNAQGIPGEQFGGSRGCAGTDSKGGVYLRMGTADMSGIWRAYNSRMGGQPFCKKEVKP